MVFWTNYPKCFLATMISLIGGVCGLMGVAAAFETFSEGPVEAILCGAVGIACFFGLRKLADIVAAKKYEKLAGK